MTKLQTSLPRILPLLLSFALALTAILASTAIYASENGCCGSEENSGCVLDDPYTPCEGDDDCYNGNFPTCCDAGGFCDSNGP